MGLWNGTFGPYSLNDVMTPTEATNLGENVDLLYEDFETFWTFPIGTASNVGDHLAVSLTNGSACRIEMIIPDHYDNNAGAQTTLDVLVSDATGGTLTYALDADFFNPDNNENFDFHSGAQSGLTVSLTANKPKLISVTGTVALATLAAGDWVGLKFTSTTSPSGALKVLGMRLRYQRVL